MTLYRASAIVGSLTVMSRVLGYARDTLIAATLGAGPIADAFFIAFKLPNLFRRLLAEGAFAAAFVPLFADAERRGGMRAARAFTGQALGFMLAALIALTIAAELAMGWIVRLLAPGFAADDPRLALAVDYARLTFPYLPMLGASALIAAALNATHRFAAAAMLPVLLNLSIITGLFTLSAMLGDAGRALALSVTLGGLVQLVFITAAATRCRLAPALLRPRLTPAMRRLWSLFAPGVVGAGLTQLTVILGMMIASLLPAGAISALYYADRVAQLPLGIVGATLGTVLLPLLTGRIGGNDPRGAARDQETAIALALLLAIPAAIGLALLARPIIDALFGHGAFDADAARMTAGVLAASALGLPAAVLAPVLQPAFFARQDTVTPVRASLLSLAANAVLALVLMRPLGVTGIALAGSLAGWINLAQLLQALASRGWFRPGRFLARRLAGISLATAAMAAAIWLIGPALDPLGPVIAPLATVAMGLVVFVAAALPSGALPPGLMQATTRRLTGPGRADTGSAS